MATEVLTSPEAAIAKLQSRQGGALRFDFDGVLQLTETVLVATNTTIDATGHDVVFDGGKRWRHFAVTNAASLRLIHLRFNGGQAAGANGAMSEAGAAGQGGSIHQSGGALELRDCLFSDNQAIGGNGGPADPSFPTGLVPGTRGGPAYGGAVYSEDGDLFISNCVFTSNAAIGGNGAASASGYTGGGGDSYGGAVYMTNGRSQLAASTFTNNLARAGQMSSGRALEGGGGAFGGAVAGEAENATATACSFDGNQAIGATKVGSDTSRETGLGEGGALFHSSGSMVMDGCFWANNASSGGLGATRGGDQIDFGNGRGGAISSRGDLEIRNSALVSNQTRGGDVPGDCCSPFIGQAGAAVGGAIATAGTLRMANSTLAANVATGGKAVAVGVFTGPAYGGALAVITGAVSLVNLTLVSNRVDVSNVRKGYGSSLAVLAGTIVCTNSILAGAPPSTNVWGSLIDGGHNLSSDASAAFQLPSSRNGIDPLLGALGNYGGLTPSVPLLPASPAIDQGDDSACPPVDQRGAARPQGEACDVGAFEVVPQLSLARAPEGQIQLQYIFRAVQTNQISASTNLLTWVALGVEVSDTNGILRFEDPAASQWPHRFYRLESAP